MKIVIQRVTHAKVAVDGNIVGQIDKGLLVLVGVTHTDTESDAEWLAAKTTSLRIFNDDKGVMNLSVKDIDGRVLAISQFTLYSDARKGNRPSYIKAARGEVAEPLYNHYCNCLEKQLGKRVERGIFGADMKVSLLNDGPVTILLESGN